MNTMKIWLRYAMAWLFRCPGILVSGGRLRVVWVALSWSIASIFGVSAHGVCSVTATNLIFGNFSPADDNPALGEAHMYVSCDDNKEHTICVKFPGASSDPECRAPHNLCAQIYTSATRKQKLDNTMCFNVPGATATSQPIKAICTYSRPCRLALYSKIVKNNTVNNSPYLVGMGKTSLFFAPVLNYDGQEVHASSPALVTWYQNSGCNISAEPLNFGVYSPSKPATRRASSRVTISCTNDSVYDLTLSKGKYSTGTSRRMKSLYGDYYLDYKLYLPAATTVPPLLQTCSYGSSAKADTLRQKGLVPARFWGNNHAQNFQTIEICGELTDTNPHPRSGIYVDTVDATITWSAASSKRHNEGGNDLRGNDVEYQVGFM